MAYVDANGVKLACTVTGSGPVLLMTHGYGDSSQVFAALAAALSHDARCVTWDLRGHGVSDAPDDPGAYTAEAALADMAALLDHVGAERAVLVGHSLGGYLSLAYRRVEPARVSGLVLIGTGPGFRKDEARADWNSMTERLARRAATPGLAHAARGILPQRDASVIDSLPDVDVPTLVVVGARDETFLAGSRHMAAKIPGAELVEIAGAGHAPHVSHAAELAGAVRTLLRRVDG